MSSCSVSIANYLQFLLALRKVLSDHCAIKCFAVFHLRRDQILCVVKSVCLNIIIHGGSLDHDTDFYSLEISLLNIQI